MSGAQPYVLAASAALALAAAIGLKTARDVGFPAPSDAIEPVLYSRSGVAIERFALGFDALAADVYWIRTLQHYGGARRQQGGSNRYELLQPLLDITTTLDPFFTLAYRFGAIFLSEAPPGGPGRPDQAIALLIKGHRNEPRKWQYLHDIAFVHFWHRHDAGAAAAWFLRAAEVPEAPAWLRPMAAAMLAANDRGAARVLWTQILSSGEVWLRRTAERSLLQLEALDQIDALQAVAERATLPGRPLTWTDLVQRRIINAAPQDPMGEPYLLDPQTGVVSLGPKSGLFPLPDFEQMRKIR